MVKPWFDPVTGDLLFDDYVADRPSYQNVLRDAMVSDPEIDEQADRVAGLFRRLEPMLDPVAKELATEAP